MTRVTESPPLPSWLQAPWLALLGARRADHFPHALLLTGPLGVGKRLLVEALGRSLLCPRTDAQGFACGQCPDCLLLAAGTHPDLIQVGPDEETKSGEIKVDAIRALAGTEGLTAHRGGWKLIVIDPAHRLNLSAANALLKTLEEPAPSTLICLVSEQPSRLLATIRSRCQALRLPLPAEAEALAWLGPQVRGLAATTLLHLAHGAPLRALELADPERLARRDKLFGGFVAVAQGQRDPLGEAAAWNEADPALLLDWLSGWLSDLLRLAGTRLPATADVPVEFQAAVQVEVQAEVPTEVQAGIPAKVAGAGQAPTAPRLINSDKATALTALAARVDPAAGHRLLHRVWQAAGRDNSNLNRLLLYEGWLLDWVRLTRPAAVSAGTTPRPPQAAPHHPPAAREARQST